MGPAALALKEVNIKSDVTAIKIKGDTIEYNAKAYVVQPNDKVEDMLKQLPGFDIDKDGHISVQGERVRKVLLDGEEFFGDDPTLITRNIRGDMVDKIQYYEKKSDMATATGIDDGKGQKVINVQLKKDRNTGVFGKVLGGAGTDGYYEGQGFVNKFTKNYKAAAYGTISNDGKVGLGGADNSRLGMNNLSVVMAGGVMITSIGGVGSSQLDRESYGGHGLPESKTGGAHYDTKWNNGTETLNANYKAGDLSTTTDQNALTCTTYANNVENAVSDQHIVADLNRQKVDGAYTKRYKTGNIRVDVNASVQNNHDLNNITGVTTNDDGSLKNNNNHFDDTHTQQKSLNANMFYTGPLKKGFFSWGVQEAYNNNQGNEYLKTQFTTPSALGNTLTDQFKTSTASGVALGSSMSYSKALSKKVNIVFNYDLNLNNSVSNLASYNQSAPGIYNVLDTTYSSNYKLNQLNNRLGVSLRIPIGKSSLNFGNGANIVSFKQTNENTGYVYQRNFTNWSPRAGFSYFAGQSKYANFSYSGSSQQPSINQVQPVVNNNNPLSTIIGNPNLKPYFTNNFNGSYRSFDQLTGQTFTIYGSYSVTSNPIIYNQTYDEVTGKSIYQNINLEGKTQQNYNVNVSYTKKITPWDMQVSLDLLATHTSSYTPLNGILTNYLFYYYETGIRLQKNKLKKYNLSLAVVPNWNLYNHLPVTALAPDYTTFNCNIRADANFFLPGKLQIGSSFFERVRGPINNIPNANATDWSATFSKTLLKEDALKLSLTCNNLLNEGGFVRSNNGPTINQTTYNTIKRFFLFSVSWDFAHFPSIPVKN